MSVAKVLSLSYRLSISAIWPATVWQSASRRRHHRQSGAEVGFFYITGHGIALS